MRPDVDLVLIGDGGERTYLEGRPGNGIAERVDLRPGAISTLAAGLAVMLPVMLLMLVILGWGWGLVPGFVLGAFLGQASINTYRRRKIERRRTEITRRWDRMQRSVGAPVDQQAAARRERLAQLKIHLDAGLLWLDFDSGEVWPPERIGEEIKRLESKPVETERAALSGVLSLSQQDYAEALHDALTQQTAYRRSEREGYSLGGALEVTARRTAEVVHRPAPMVGDLFVERHEIHAAEQAEPIRVVDMATGKRLLPNPSLRSVEVIKRDIETVKIDLARGAISLQVAGSLAEDLFREMRRARDGG